MDVRSLTLTAWYAKLNVNRGSANTSDQRPGKEGRSIVLLGDTCNSDAIADAATGKLVSVIIQGMY